MRLFTAVHFSPEVRHVLLDAAAYIRAHSKSANITRPENLHLTLAFIGETDDIAGARAAIDRCGGSAFRISVGGFGCFGDLYWAGIEESHDLSALAENVRGSLRNQGFDIETRPFKPHITLARQVLSDAPLRVLLPKTSMAVRRISLMKSERINGKLTYTEVYGKDLI